MRHGRLQHNVDRPLRERVRAAVGSPPGAAHPDAGLAVLVLGEHIEK
jgi:hypothetical protein